MKALPRPILTFEVTLHLREDEARALEVLAGYSHNALLKALTEHLKCSRIKSYEKGLESFMAAVNLQVRHQLQIIDESRILLASQLK